MTYACGCGGKTRQLSCKKHSEDPTVALRVRKSVATQFAAYAKIIRRVARGRVELQPLPGTGDASEIGGDLPRARHIRRAQNCVKAVRRARPREAQRRGCPFKRCLVHGEITCGVLGVVAGDKLGPIRLTVAVGVTR